MTVEELKQVGFEIKQSQPIKSDFLLKYPMFVLDYFDRENELYKYIAFNEEGTQRAELKVIFQDRFFHDVRFEVF